MTKEELWTGSVFVVHHFLLPEECSALIAASEGQGYDAATISVGDGMAAIVKDFRNNLRVMFDDTVFAAKLLTRVRPFLPAQVWVEGRERTLVGLNERFRFYRYDAGHSFEPHYDGPFTRNEREESVLTFMVYLNDECTGGTTDFYEQGARKFSVRPRQGMALVFRHELLHAGAPVTRGRKYVLRTDVMYSLVG